MLVVCANRGDHDVHADGQKLVLEGKDSKLPDAIRIGAAEGMQDFTMSLKDLIDKELIDRPTAFAVAHNKMPSRWLQGYRSQSARYHLIARDRVHCSNVYARQRFIGLVLFDESNELELRRLMNWI